MKICPSCDRKCADSMKYCPRCNRYLGGVQSISEQEYHKDVEIGNKMVECPYCHSANVKKISTTSRMISTWLVGLASKKIGKQWHCNQCGSDF